MEQPGREGQRQGEAWTVQISLEDVSESSSNRAGNVSHYNSESSVTQ